MNHRKVLSFLGLIGFAILLTLGIAKAGPPLPEDLFIPSGDELEFLSTQDDYDVGFYDIKVMLDFDGEKLYGEVTVSCTSLVDGLSFMDLDFVRTTINHPFQHLDVDSVSVEGAPSAWSWQWPQYVRVHFGGNVKYNRGQNFVVTVYYHGYPHHFTDFFGFSFSQHGSSATPVAYDNPEPYYARYWWPCKDRPDDKALVDISVTTSRRDFKCASIGELQEVIMTPTTRTDVWHEHHPVATYQVGIGVTNYDTLTLWYHLQDGSDSMPIIFYVYPENRAIAESAFAIVPNMLETFASLLGEYPYVDEKLGIMQVPLHAGAMEFPTMIAICDTTYDPWTIAHEIFHMWFGDYVTCATWHDIWVNEGFATYGACIWFEKYYGLDSLLSWMDSHRIMGYGSVYAENIWPPYQVLNWKLAYQKAAWVLHMYRNWVGDATFYATLNSILAQHPWGNASTEDVIQTAVAVSGDARVRNFFEEWIYGAYHPRYEYAYHYLGNHELALMIRQVQNPSASPWIPDVYHMPLDIVIDYGSQSETLRVFIDQRRQDTVVHISSLTAPQNVRISLDWTLADATRSYDCWLVTEPLREATVGLAYDDTTGFACEASASLTIADGALPPGLVLDNTTGQISGAPLSSGTYDFSVKAAETENGPFYYNTYSILVRGSICGDANGDCAINISDAVFLIAYIFADGEAPAFCNYNFGMGDANGDGTVNISDAVYLIAYIFAHGAAPHCLGSPALLQEKVIPSLKATLSLEPVQVEQGPAFLDVRLTSSCEIAGVQLEFETPSNLIVPSKTDRTEAMEIKFGNVGTAFRIGLIDMGGRHLISAGDGPVIRLDMNGSDADEVKLIGAVLCDRQGNELNAVIGGVPTPSTSAEANLPTMFDLEQNHPNPFNPETQINFSLPEGCYVDLAVFNVLGERVRSLVSGYKAAGTHTVIWDGRSDNGTTAPSGVYFYTMTTPGHVETKKMLLLK